MYYAAKALELLGISMIAVGFIIKYPKLMDPKLLLGALICFGAGWVIEKYILQ
tara:strand:+ start:830 stop:988 length:159 start_codon:yes stop_codon:yes gene_type:complete